VRLDRIRELDDCRNLVEPMDHQGLLAGYPALNAGIDEIDDDEFLAQLGVEEESNLLMCSFQKAVQQDPTGRRIIEPAAGPLFADESEEGDEPSGVVYVLRSKSDNPIAGNRAILHKIGVTGGDVPRRIANARLDPTFFMADVEIVATYELYNIARSRLENLIHRIFGAARLDIEIKDRFGNPIVPREWFLVPLFVIDQAIDKIRDGTITGFAYDPKTASLSRTGG
jgi:hypothetical protein